MNTSMKTAKDYQNFLLATRQGLGGGNVLEEGDWSLIFWEHKEAGDEWRLRHKTLAIDCPIVGASDHMLARIASRMVATDALVKEYNERLDYHWLGFSLHYTIGR